MAYLTNEAITVELAGYEITNLPYAENGVPYVAETVLGHRPVPRREPRPAQGVPDRRDQGLDRTCSPRPTDDTVALVTEYYDAAADAGDLDASVPLDPEKTSLAPRGARSCSSPPRRPRRTASSRSPTTSRQQTVDSLEAAGWDV